MEAIEGLKDIFAGEAEEILQNLEPDIVRLEEGSEPEVINRIFRYVHTLKGSSGMAGLNNISEFTHKLENLMDGVRSGKLQVDNSLIEILLGSMDWIKLIIFGGHSEIDPEKMKTRLLKNIEEFKENGIPKKLDALKNVVTGELKEKVTLYRSGEEAKDKYGISKDLSKKAEDERSTGYKFYRIIANFKKTIFGNGIDPLIIIEDLASLGRITSRKVDRKKLPEFEELDPEICYLNWDITIRTLQPMEKIDDVFLFVKSDNDIKIEDVTKNYKIPENLEAFKLGEIMLSENIITEDELSNVLDAQKKSEGKKIAEIMVEKGYASPEDVKYALEEQDKIKKKIDSTTVRVATGKLDNLLNLLGEIVIGQSALSRVAEEMGSGDGERLKSAVYGLERTTREFQEQIMSIRMIPIAPSFERFKRFVRDTAKEYKKEIKLVIEGGETELDKTVIEKIADPLKHMIRNSIDHGIEIPDERLKTGKDRTGIIALKAYHQEGNVYIEVSDDGRGIDKNKLRRKAEQNGLIRPSDELTDEKLFSFLFLPGFSTAEKVGSLSGRGVGMDVVKTNIDELRGTIIINTDKGKGTSFIIKLPLTLAIIDGMLVRVGVHTYIIPLLSIVQSIQPDKDSLKTVKGQGEVLHVRGQYISLLRMYKLFNIESDFKNPWECLVVIVESNGVSLGIMVDEVIGQQQIVIKSMQSGVTNSRAISGASILGDGTVTLIIDVHGLVSELAA